jgi:hypothetical protein
MRPWARRVLRSSSCSHHSSTLRGSALGTGIWTRCWTTRTGPWLGAWLACHALFRHVAEHHFGTRPRDGTGTLFPHQPHSTDWSGRRWDTAEPDILDGVASTAATPSGAPAFIVTTICCTADATGVRDFVVRDYVGGRPGRVASGRLPGRGRSRVGRGGAGAPNSREWAALKMSARAGRSGSRW